MLRCHRAQHFNLVANASALLDDVRDRVPAKHRDGIAVLLSYLDAADPVMQPFSQP